LIFIRQIDLRSLDFVINRFFMKLFKTGSYSSMPDVFL